MTLEEFIATKRWSDNIDKEIGFQADFPHVGYLYLGELYISRIDNEHWSEQMRKFGKWFVQFDEEDEISDDLEELERKLFEYAVANGYEL